MRNPNGYGGVTRLPGRRRRPWRARITAGWDAAHQQFATLGYYETRTEALIALAEYNRLPWDLRRQNITFREAYDMWSPRHFKQYPSARRVTECAMEHCRALWDRPMTELRTADLQAVMDSLGELSHGYRLKIRTLMHMQYEWCIKNDVLFRDYSRFVELGKASGESGRHVFTSEEVRRIRALCDGDAAVYEPPKYCGAGLFDTLPLLLYTGMRVGELLALRWEDVHLDERYIDLHGTKTRAARRKVPLHRDVLPILRRMAARGGEFVVAPFGVPMTYSQYKYSWFDKVMHSLGMAHTPHDTRHTFISGMDTCGVPRTAVKFIVGHSLSRDVTDGYTHKAVAELIREVDKLEY